MAAQAWLCTGGCKVVPSCFHAACRRHKNPLAIVADGSSSLHVLESSSTRHMATVKLPSKVYHVSQLYSTAGSLPVAVCGLSSGQIVSVPVDRVLSRAHSVATSSETQWSSSRVSQPRDDIFEALLGEIPDTAEEGQGAHQLDSSGEEMVVDIASLPQHLKSTVNAVRVHGNKLLMFSRAGETGEETLAVCKSSSSVCLDGYKVPTFSEPPVAQYTLSPALVRQSGLSLGQTCLHRHSAFVIVQQTGSREGRSMTTGTVQFLTRDLFLQLFGPEYELSSSPVAIFSSQSGCVYYCLLNTLTDPQSTQLSLLYNLEEPVVAIHAVQLPRNPSQDEEDHFLLAPRDDPEGANTLLLVGQNGKIVASSVTSSEQAFAHFTEFHVPGSILSSLLVPDHSLLYTTLSGLHEICLRPDCMKSSVATTSSCGPILIPRIAFQFPNQISKFSSFLLSVSSDSQLPNKVVAMSPKGLVCTLTVSLPSEGTSSTDTLLAAQGIESSLKAIEATSKQIEAVKCRLSSINSALAELSGALHFLLSLRAVGRSRESGLQDCQGSRSSLQQPDSGHAPISCSLVPMFESRDVTHSVPCVEVRLHYHGNKALGQGWSLVIHTLPSTPAPVSPPSGLQDDAPTHLRPVLSRVVPLTGMAVGNSPLSVKVYPCASLLRPLAFRVCCSLHYDASRLLAALGQDAPYPALGQNAPYPALGQDAPYPALGQDRTHVPGSVTNSSSGAVCVLDTRHFDVLDFLHCSSSILCPSVMDLKSQINGCQSSLSQPPVFLHHTLELPVPPVSEPDTARGLEGLLPPQLREQLVSMAAEVRCRAYDGSVVSLREEEEEQRGTGSGKRLVIQTVSRAMLAEVCGSVCQRWHRERDHWGVGCREPSEQRYHLQRMANDITSLQAELNSLSCDRDREKTGSLATKAFQLYCRLRCYDL